MNGRAAGAGASERSHGYFAPRALGNRTLKRLKRFFKPQVGGSLARIVDFSIVAHGGKGRGDALVQ